MKHEVRILSKRHLYTMLVTALSMLSYNIAQSQNANPIPEAGVQELEWNFDGSRLAEATSNGQVLIRDQNGVILMTLSRGQVATYAIAWSPDGNLIASGGYNDPMIQIWNAESGSLIREIQGIQGGVYELAWQPTGGILLGSGFDTFQAWSTETWEPLTQGLGTTLLNIEWKPDGSIFAFSSISNIGTRVFVNGSVEGLNFGQEQTQPFIYGIDWNTDGTQIVSAGGQDGTVRLWDAASGQQLSTLLNISDVVTDVQFTDIQGDHVAVTTRSGMIYVINSETADIEQQIVVDAQLQTLAWNAINDSLAFGGVSVESSAEIDEAFRSMSIESGFLSIIPVQELLTIETDVDPGNSLDSTPQITPEASQIFAP